MTLTEALMAAGPASADLELFGQFVGDWEMDITFYDESGAPSYHGIGSWHFGWVLDGHAIQDVFTYPTPSGRGIGTTLRTYSPDRDEWQIVYLGAVSGVLCTLRGGRVGESIRLEGTDTDGHNRWTFSDITPTSFTWTGQLSADGRTWHTNHRMYGRRRSLC